MMRTTLVVALLLLPCPSWAQASVVLQVKQDLQARGFDLSGPCGAFAITSRVAWRLRGSGIGLFEKTTGNNCRGYSVDVLVYRNGQAYDILSDAGGDNGAGWNAIDPVDPQRWREPFDPGDPPAGGGGVEPPIVSGGATPTQVREIVHQEMLTLYEQAERIFASQDDFAKANAAAIMGKLDAIQADVNNPGWFKRLVSSPAFRYGSMVLTGILVTKYGGIFGEQSATPQGAQ